MESLLARDLAPSIATIKVVERIHNEERTLLCFSLLFNKKFHRDNSNNFKKKRGCIDSSNHYVYYYLELYSLLYIES